MLYSLAEVAESESWVRPQVDDSQSLEIEAGRHPVVERQLQEGHFVPNDVELDVNGDQILVITGPNMAGKSTIIRQIGLAVVLAQMGSFVPARRARIGVVDRLFTRVGASDNLARGESTFMVEMNEASTILNNVTHRSLVLIDELGRGTSTFDGLSIAWSIVEYLHDGPVHPRALFATHYHELTELEQTLARVKNCNVQVREESGRIVFLHRMAIGPCDRSYGINVAQMAGMPGEVVARAQEILAELEQSRGGDADDRTQNDRSQDDRSGAGERRQMDLFGRSNGEQMVAELMSIDVSETTPWRHCLSSTNGNGVSPRPSRHLHPTKSDRSLSRVRKPRGLFRSIHPSRKSRRLPHRSGRGAHPGDSRRRGPRHHRAAQRIDAWARRCLRGGEGGRHAGVRPILLPGQADFRRRRRCGAARLAGEVGVATGTRGWDTKDNGSGSD